MKRGPVLTWIRRIWIAAGLGFTAFLVWSVQPHGVPAGVLDPGPDLAVSTTPEGATMFEPAAADPASPVLVLLPGGLVAPRAYLPIARAIADRGVTLALVPLPYRSAPSDASRGVLWTRMLEAAARWPDRPLVVGGHSRGGALAARFVAAHPGRVAGLILMGTTHPRDEDLSASAVRVLKILGSRDCVASERDARANAARLPATTRWVVIEGANHAQFADYGWQIGDCDAAIDRRTQQGQVVDAILTFMRDLGR
ncbi:MAG: alpha/beta hydrolase [Vicinamibacterales bacterium]